MYNCILGGLSLFLLYLLCFQMDFLEKEPFGGLHHPLLNELIINLYSALLDCSCMFVFTILDNSCKDYTNCI